MLHKDQEYDLAKTLYFTTSRSQTNIADLIGIDRKTLYLWAKNGRWDELRAARRQSPVRILQDTYNHIDAINTRIFSRPAEEQCPTLQEVDMLRKLTTMARNMEKQHTGNYMEVIEELTYFVADHDVQLAKQVIDIFDRFVKGTVLNKHFRAHTSNKTVSANLKIMDEMDHPAATPNNEELPTPPEPTSYEPPIPPVPTSPTPPATPPTTTTAPAQPPTITPLPLVSPNCRMEHSAQQLTQLLPTSPKSHNLSHALKGQNIIALGTAHRHKPQTPSTDTDHYPPKTQRGIVGQSQTAQPIDNQ